METYLVLLFSLLPPTARMSGQCTLDFSLFISSHYSLGVSLYEASSDLEYLDMVVQEALRMYPPLPKYVSMSKSHTMYVCNPHI